MKIHETNDDDDDENGCEKRRRRFAGESERILARGRRVWPLLPAAMTHLERF